MSATVDVAVEAHALPNGGTVYYRDENHSYWSGYDPTTGKCSGRLTGVTTVVKPYDFSPDALMGWAVKMTREGVSILAADALGLDGADDMRTALSWLGSQEGIGEALKDAHLRHTDKRDDAADRGTNVHDVVLHALATGSPVPDMPSLTPEERGFAQAVIGWWLDKRPEPLLAELVVADPDGLGVAGRLDLVAMIDGRRTLVDLKTSASGIRTTGHVQVAGYRHLLELSGFDPVERSVIVHARGDGSYYEAACEATTEGFLNAVAVYRDAARIKRCASAAERASA